MFVNKDEYIIYITQVCQVEHR